MKTKSTLHDLRHMTVIEILKKSRLEKRLKQDDLADRMGVSRVYISKVESGDRNLTYIELIDYCKALGIDIHSLIKSIDKEHEVPDSIYSDSNFMFGYAAGFMHGHGEETINSIPARISSKESKADE